LVYDPSNQTLLADKGKIEIGSRHQAEIPAYIGQSDEEKMSVSKENASDSPNSSGEESNKPSSVQIQLTDREQVVYHPHHELTDRDIDQFLIIARFHCATFIILILT
jgi:metastasis-associated protein MTA